MTTTELGVFLVSRGLAATFLAVPAAPTVTLVGTAGATTYSYKIVAKNQIGQTTGSATGSTTTGNAALSGTNYNRPTWVAIPGATGYDIYRVQGGATQGLIGSTTSLTFNDTGLAGDGSSSPATNTAATDIGLGDLPETPNKAYGLLVRPGRPSVGRFGGRDLSRESPQVQVLTRGEPDDPQETELRANAAYRALGTIQAQTLSGVFYENVTILQAPYQQPSDKNRRALFMFGLLIVKAPSLS